MLLTFNSQTFDLIVSRNDADECVILVNDTKLTPYISVDGKRYLLNDLLALIPANDAALDWADANARAFPIETAPTEGSFQVWDSDLEQWETIAMFVDGARWAKRITHWRPLPPPPSNPPLPEPLEALGAVLRKIKGA